jgi:hypothetical protein
MAVVRANYVKRGAGERATAKANIRYIQARPGRDKEQRTRTLFGAAGFLSRYEAYQFIDEGAKQGRYFYRLKLSPDPEREDSQRDLNMQKLTRQMMRRLEKRLGTGLPWAAALHDDHTDIRHVHILAAIPRRLLPYELEFLIREATQLSLAQRRFLDRGEPRLPWQQPELQQTIQSGKYLFSLSEPRRDYRTGLLPRRSRWGRVRPVSASCTCPRCHMPQVHDRRGSHGCPSCGYLLHKKKEPTVERRKRGGWEHSW